MDLFLAGTDVNLTIPLQDRSGNPLNVTSVSYDVVDMNNNVLVAQTQIAGFVAGQTSVAVTVPASINQLAAIDPMQPMNQMNPESVRAIRSVRLYCIVSGNTIILTKAYGIEPTDPLVVGVNSFQTYALAELTALDVPNTPGWDNASDNDRIAAMIDARSHICQLSYYLLNSNINFAQDSLNYIPEGAFQSNYVATNSLFIFNGNLALLDVNQYNQLPERFKSALRLAQVAEADAILGSDEIGDKRRAGVMLESIGETKQMYRPSKPLNLPVCKRALEYLSYFVVFNRTVGR